MNQEGPWEFIGGKVTQYELKSQSHLQVYMAECALTSCGGVRTALTISVYAS